MPQRIMLTGGSGFVGSVVLRELLAGGHEVNALINEAPLYTDDPKVHAFSGGLFNDRALEQAMAGCQAVIHLVGIIDERPGRGVTFERMHTQATRRIIEAAARVGVNRFIHMSAMGARANALSRYHQTKWQAEETVRNSPLKWTIFRPSLIHGPRGEFMRLEAAWARRSVAPYLFMPYFGKGWSGFSGAGRLQPVWVNEVAKAFVQALDLPGAFHKTYDLGGADVLTWPQMHHIASRLIVGKQRAALPIPAWYATLLAQLLPARWLPFNRDQVLMSQEDNAGNNEAFMRDFGWAPAGFESTLSTYATLL